MAEVEKTAGGDGKSDFEKAQDFIKEQVKTEFEALQAQHKPAPTVTEQEQQQRAVRQQVREVIDPIYGDDIATARFAASDAKDYVDFYQGNEIAAEYKEQVEAMFAKAKENGRPMPRADILRWVVGKEVQEQPDKYNERVAARKARELDRAGRATDFGVGADVKAKADTTFSNFANLSLEEMEKALDGVVF